MTTITRIGRPHWEARGERIEQARKFAGLTQGQLAAAVSDLIGYKISRQIIYIIEQGEDRDIRGDELRAIAAVLDQTEEWLDCHPEAEFNADPKILGKHQFRLPGLPTYTPVPVAA